MKKTKNKVFILGRLGMLGFVMLAANSAHAQWSLSNYSNYGLPYQSIYSIIANLLNWLLLMLGLFGVIGFVISGIMYLTSAGNDSRMETAKNAMYYSILGIIVGLSGLVVIYAVTYALNGNPAI